MVRGHQIKTKRGLVMMKTIEKLEKLIQMEKITSSSTFVKQTKRYYELSNRREYLMRSVSE